MACSAAFARIFNSDEVAKQFLVGSAARVTASQAGQNMWRVSNQAVQVAEESGWDLRIGDDQLLHDLR